MLRSTYEASGGEFRPDMCVTDENAEGHSYSAVKSVSSKADLEESWDNGLQMYYVIIIVLIIMTITILFIVIYNSAVLSFNERQKEFAESDISMCDAAFTLNAGRDDHPFRAVINVSWAPNFAYGMLLEARSRIEGMSISLDRMFEFMNGGEAIHAASSLECMKMLGAKGLRSNAMIPIWGMSEVAVGMTFTRKFGENLYNNSVSVGEVTRGYEIRITNGETVVENDDTEGDIEVRGEPVFSGYINYDNSLCFTPDGWFRTGDIGVWKNGEIVICGRSSENFIQNGVNISLQEITSFIQNEFSARGLSFTLRAYAVKNEDTQRDELVVFTEQPEGMTRDETVSFILEKLRIRYSFGSRYIVFLDRDEFPRTPLGKIDKKVLLRRFKAGEYEARNMLSSAAREAQPGEELSDDQRMMLFLWADNLGIKPTELTVEDAYFTIGGNSAKAAALLEKVNELFRCSVPAMDFVKYNTINALLGFIKGDAAGDTADDAAGDDDCEFIVL